MARRNGHWKAGPFCWGHSSQPQSGLGFTSHWLLTGIRLQSPHAWSRLWEPLPRPLGDRALNLTASRRSSDSPHPAGQRLPRSPLALLTRAGSHTAEFSLQLGTLAGLAAVLGGHAGPHPAPGPPPAAAGAQAPGPPLLPHAVHCKEARGRCLGGTLAPPTASACPSAHQSGVSQFYDHSLLAPPRVHLPGRNGLGSQDNHPFWECGPKPHRTGSVDTRIGCAGPV